MVGLLKYIFLGIFFFSPITEFRLGGLKISELLALLVILIIGLKHQLNINLSKGNEKFAFLFVLIILISAFLSFFDPINIYVFGVDKGPYYSFEYGWIFRIVRFFIVLCFATILERQLSNKNTFFESLCNTYIYSNILVDLYGIAVFFMTDGSFSQFGHLRTSLFAAEPSEAGFINCFAIILALRNFGQGISKLRVLVLGVLILGQLVIGSTTSIVSALLSIAITYIYYNKKVNGISGKTLMMYIVIIAVSILLFYWLANYTQILDKFLNVQDDMYDSGSSSVERLTTIETCWEIFKVRPFLGVGFGNFGWYLDHYVTSSLLLYVPSGAFQPNNTYMQILAELGIVGFMVYFWFIFLQFRRITRLLKHDNKNRTVYLCFSLLLYLLIHGFTLPTIYSFQFWFVVAVIQYLVSNINKRDENTFSK